MPPWVLRMRISLPPIRCRSQPMPAFMAQPNRSPEGRWSSISAVMGRVPARAGALERTSNREASPVSRMRSRSGFINPHCRLSRVTRRIRGNQSGVTTEILAPQDRSFAPSESSTPTVDYRHNVGPRKRPKVHRTNRRYKHSEADSAYLRGLCAASWHRDSMHPALRRPNSARRWNRANWNQSLPTLCLHPARRFTQWLHHGGTQ